MSNNQTLLLIITLIFTIPEYPSYGTILPYRVRTRDFSSWTPSTRGDINTIGMSGASVATPTSISAAEANPAGFAMLTGSVTAQINKLSLNDNRLQRTGDPIDSSQWGIGVSPAHRGFSLSYYSPQTESGIYASPNTGDTVKTEVSMKELRFTGAYAFLADTLALGASVELLKGVREVNDESSNALGVSYRIGALYRLPMHILLGASFAPEGAVGPAGHPDPQSPIPGFNRSIIRPMLISFGEGWIPNRFFKAAGSITLVGSTKNTALLADESVTTGAVSTWVPRIGASYVLGEYANFKIESAVGSYFEVSRLSDRSNRLHMTASLEANPYFINLGAGMDISSDYKNLIVSVGIDIVRTARAFDIIPKDPVPPINGPWPNVFQASADGLPDGLTQGEKKNFEAPSVEQVGKILQQVPENISKRVSGEKTTVQIKEDQAKKKKNKNKKKKHPSKKPEKSELEPPTPGERGP